jgi:hypothetical protein
VSVSVSVSVKSFAASCLLAVACTSAEPRHSEPPPPPPSSVSREDLGRRITLEGEAVNHKNGAALQVGDVSVWIDGLSSWPDGYFVGGRGRTVSVTGVLAEDHGLPVFVPRDDEPLVQGIPVPEGTDLDAASRRFVLRDATWQ